jgi:diguanylate cyclase (GGDEF)-like protein
MDSHELADPGVGANDVGAPRERLSARLRPILIGGLILVVGLGTSAFLAAEWRASALSANRQAFDSQATDLSGTLKSKLNTTTGLTRVLRAIATMEPSAGQTRLLQWYQELQRDAPLQPGVVAVLIQPVPASGLPAFRRQLEADPASRARLGGSFQVVPSGKRPVYCLTRAIVGTAGATSLFPPLLDYCAPVIPGIGPSPYGPLIRTLTDTGTFIVMNPSASASLTAIGAAVYRRGASIATVPARRAALSGLIATTFDSVGLIKSVLVGRRSLTLALYHKNNGGQLQLIGRAGANPTGRSPGYSKRVGLREGWLLEVTGTAERPIAADQHGLLILGLGLLVTVLVLLLHRVLSRSRVRAWGLVGEKTGELEYRAVHDPLTGLPNRTLAMDRAGQILARARRLNAPVTALFMDLDGLKQVNDRFGHQAGDEVLRQVGARLTTVMRDTDAVGRIGGDEFVMLIDSAGLDVGPELVAERLLGVLRQPIELPAPAASPASITASIGIATGLPASVEELLADAEVALYKAKAAGRDGYVLFEMAMQTAAHDRMHLEMDLGEALGAEELFVVYQPMLSLATEQVVGVEALLRWRHATRGVIAPDEFIPIAEESGLIVAIGHWVLEEACSQGAAWRRKGLAIGISVNVSARQLERGQFVQEVRSVLADSGLDAAALTLEITETVLMRNPTETARMLTELKGLGVRIAVDDFGTGYSSLAYLRQFPVDSLKIDRTFITGFALSTEGRALAHTLIQLGKALGLQTLAEGVEQHDQVRQLLQEGCDLAQGFLFARPLTPEAVERFLHDGTGVAGTPRQTRSPTHSG